MRAMILLLPVLLTVACGKDASPTSSSSDVTAIRQMITDWELGIETSNMELLSAQFLPTYWPNFISAGAINQFGGLSLRVSEVEIQVGLQGESATASFRAGIVDQPGQDWRVVWSLSEPSRWFVVEEDWTAP